MEEGDALSLINQLLEKILKEPIAVSADADLIEEEILDSLDGMVFLLEVETATGLKFPDDVDLVEEGYYRVSKLLDLMTDKP